MGRFSETVYFTQTSEMNEFDDNDLIRLIYCKYVVDLKHLDPKLQCGRTLILSLFSLKLCLLTLQNFFFAQNWLISTKHVNVSKAKGQMHILVSSAVLKCISMQKI